MVNVNVNVTVNPQNNDDADAKYINLIVRYQQIAPIHFKIKKAATFQKLFDTYCQRTNLARNIVRFHYDGARMVDTETPLSLGMEEGDIIDVFMWTDGGGDKGRRSRQWLVRRMH